MPMKTVDASTLKHWIDKDEVLVIDVREPSEYASEHIAEATLIPLGSMSMQVLPKIKHGHKLVIHCRSGKRSQHACEQLLQEEPSLEIYNLEDGILGWIAKGHPVITSS